MKKKLAENNKNLKENNSQLKDDYKNIRNEANKTLDDYNNIVDDCYKLDKIEISERIRPIKIWKWLIKKGL